MNFKTPVSGPVPRENGRFIALRASVRVLYTAVKSSVKRKMKEKTAVAVGARKRAVISRDKLFTYTK